MICSQLQLQLYLIRLCLCVCVFGPDSRRVLRLLIRLGDLPVAVDHLYQQPEGQEHQQHIHHDLRVEGCGVFAGCGAQTRKNVLFSADTTSDCLPVCICVLSRVESTCLFFVFHRFKKVCSARSCLCDTADLGSTVIIEKAVILCYANSLLSFHWLRTPAQYVKQLLLSS